MGMKTGTVGSVDPPVEGNDDRKRRKTGYSLGAIQMLFCVQRASVAGGMLIELRTPVVSIL